VIDDISIKNGEETANFFNKKFNELCKDTNTNPCEQEALILAQNGFELNQVKFNFTNVTADNVIKVIKLLKNKRSAGWDEIPLDIMKKAMHSIAVPLSVLINQSFECCVFPDSLKYAEVKPLFKNGQKQNPDNYRPISVLTSFSRIFEKVALIQISKYLESHSILVSDQFGFRKGHSTVGAINELVNDVSWALDESQSTLGVFCDLSKAFDCVNHSILLKKLDVYQFSNKSISWIRSYLHNRFQRTVVMKNNTISKSSWVNIQMGVPQGSILGPLLFLLYVNDLPRNISSKTILYADDTTAIIKARSKTDLEQKINQTFFELARWFDVNGLKLNQGKTQLLNFRTAQAKEGYNTEIFFEDQLMPLCDSAKFIGIELDINFSWSKCISNIIDRLNTACFQMLVLRNYIDLKMRINIYYAFFSVVNYGIEFWGLSCDSEKVFKLQKKFLRIMTFSPFRTSCKSLFSKSKILTVPNLYLFKTLVMVHTNYASFFNDNFDHKYNTRFKNNFQYPIHRLRLIEKTPTYMGKNWLNFRICLHRMTSKASIA